MSTEKYTPPGERFPESEESVKSYSQIWFFLAIGIPGLLLADLIIVFIFDPTLGKILYSGLWTTIGANILGVLGMLLFSTVVAFVIKIGDGWIEVIGFPYKYTIRREDIEDVILLTGGFAIKPKPGIRYTFLIGYREHPGYKFVGVLPTKKTYKAYIEIANMFLPLISRVDIIWENVPPQYKAEIIELVNRWNRWREIKGIGK